MAKTRKSTSKVKKKKWHMIVSPKSMGEKPLGESYLSDIGSAVGRTVKVNLMQLIGDVKSQNSSVVFEISGVRNNKLETRITGYSFSPASIKRYVRRRMTRIDDSILIKTKDNKLVRIKPFLLTRDRVSRSVVYAIRSALRKELANLAIKSNYEDLFNLIIKYQIQKEFRKKLSKIYPIRSFEIRIVKEEKRDVHKLHEPIKLEKTVKIKESKEEKPEKKTEQRDESVEKPKKVESVKIEPELKNNDKESKETKPKKKIKTKKAEPATKKK